MIVPGIKICGLKDPDTAVEAVEAGADFIGILCFEGSKRFVEVDRGREIAEAVIETGGTPVAVCVDQDAEAMLKLCESMNLSVVQCAGPASRASQRDLPDYIQRIYVIPVAHDGKLIDENVTVPELKYERDYIMYDGVDSGSGSRFDWRYFSKPSSLRFFLAGGLNARNVQEAIRLLKPDFVDVSSGVESAPGVKDSKKIAEFIRAVKEVHYDR